MNLSDEPTIIKQTTSESGTLVVHLVEEARRKIYFRSKLEGMGEQMEDLRSPLAENFYVDMARRHLALAAPAIRSQTPHFLDTETNKLIPPSEHRSGVSPTTADGKQRVVPLWLVEFDDAY